LDDRREGFRSISSSQFHGVFPRHVCCTYWEKLVDRARSTIRYLSPRQGRWSICLAQKNLSDFRPVFKCAFPENEYIFYCTN
jgi:hypothetical protein